MHGGKCSPDRFDAETCIPCCYLTLLLHVVLSYMQEQAGGLQKYMQHLGKLPAFQKGLEQALGKNPTQELQNALSQRSALPQKPRVPIPGVICSAHWF